MKKDEFFRILDSLVPKETFHLDYVKTVEQTEKGVKHGYILKLNTLRDSIDLQKGQVDKVEYHEIANKDSMDKYKAWIDEWFERKNE